MPPGARIVLAVTGLAEHEGMPGAVRGDGPWRFIIVFHFEHPAAEFVIEPQRSSVIREVAAPGTERSETTVESRERAGVPRHEQELAGLDGSATGEIIADIAPQFVPGEVLGNDAGIVDFDPLKIVRSPPLVWRIIHDLAEHERRFAAACRQRFERQNQVGCDRAGASGDVTNLRHDCASAAVRARRHANLNGRGHRNGRSAKERPRLAVNTRETIEHVFYPVFPPDQNAPDILAWLSSRNRN